MILPKLILIAAISALSNFANSEPKDCAPEARIFQLLHSAGGWTRLIRIEYGKEVDGHAICIFSLSNDDLWVYDSNTGSNKLGTKSHDILEITKSLGEFYEKIRSSKFMDEQ